MAKELPYFKFFVSEWSDGDITLEDYEVQGLFINICSYYWSKDCDVSLIKLRKRFKGYDKSIDILIESEIMHVDNGNLQIKFLLEQLEERGELSNKNSLSAKKRWDAIRAAKLLQSGKDAIALPTQYEKDAIKRREEEDKKREEKKLIVSTPIVPIEGQEIYKTKKGKTLTGKRLETFKIFWAKFNYKFSKAEAADAWLEIKTLNTTLCEEIYKAAEREAKSRPALKEQGLTPKMAQGWITAKRWEDEPETQIQVKTGNII